MALPSTSITPHSVIAKVLHWGFIVVFIYALTKQLDEVDELEDFSLLHYEMAFAVVFLALLAIRFAYMRLTRPTALPDNTPQQTKRLARMVHLGMYGSLAMIPASGLCIGALFWMGTKSGLAMDAALLVHEIAVNTTYLLILGHIAAALYHRRQRDGIWNAMVPIWREPPDARAS